MFSDLDELRRGLLEEFVTWRNLQALRAAANGPNGERARVRRAPAKRKAAARPERAGARFTEPRLRHSPRRERPIHGARAGRSAARASA